jgi:hypothetical protein
MGGQWTGLGHAVPGRVVTNAEPTWGAATLTWPEMP